MFTNTVSEKTYLFKDTIFMFILLLVMCREAGKVKKGMQRVPSRATLIDQDTGNVYQVYKLGTIRNNIIIILYLRTDYREQTRQTGAPAVPACRPHHDDSGPGPLPRSPSVGDGPLPHAHGLRRAGWYRLLCQTQSPGRHAGPRSLRRPGGGVCASRGAETATRALAN